MVNRKVAVLLDSSVPSFPMLLTRCKGMQTFGAAPVDDIEVSRSRVAICI